jgi:hypothetical protein
MSRTYFVAIADTNFEFDGTEEYAIGFGLALFRWEPPEHINVFEPSIPLFVEHEDRDEHKAVSGEIDKHIVECDAYAPLIGAEKLSKDDESKMVDGDFYYVDHYHPDANDVTLKLSKAALDGFLNGLEKIKELHGVTVYHNGKLHKEIKKRR